MSEYRYTSEKREEDLVDLALSELENAMDALYKLNRETKIVDDVEYNKINRAIWEIECILKDWEAGEAI